MPEMQTAVFDYVIDILQIVVPFASAVLLFYLTTLKESKVSKHSIYRERLDKYYIPFYQMYCRGLFSEYPMGEKPFENRGLLLDHFSKNLQYMDATSQSLYPKYYRAFLDLMEAEGGHPSLLPAAQQNMTAIFNEITKATFIEYKRLLKRLKLPVPEI